MELMEEILQRNIRHEKKLCQLTDQLFNSTPFSFITYFTITNQGFYTGYTSDVPWFEHFISERLFFSEMMRHPQFYRSGISIFSEDVQPQEELAKEFTTVRQYYHPLYLLKVTQEGFEGYCLCSRIKGLPTLEYYINNFECIKRFISHFHEETKEIRNSFCYNMINFKQLIGKSFETPPPYIKGITLEPQTVLATDSLTPSELNCLRHLLAGKNAQETAAILHRSQRTVETHLTNIKSKWSCKKKSDLFEKAHELGLTSPPIQCLF